MRPDRRLGDDLRCYRFRDLHDRKPICLNVKEKNLMEDEEKLDHPVFVGLMYTLLLISALGLILAIVLLFV